MTVEPMLVDHDCTVYGGDCLTVLKTLPAESIQCCVTSPPYWCLRNYGADGQLGLEKTPEEYVENLVEVFREVRRVLRNDGILWLNIGDSYATDHAQTRNGGQRGLHAKIKGAESAREGRPPPPGMKPKDLVGIPWMVAFALRADGWYLRSDCIWDKQNAMPESVLDRPTKSHEYIFLLSKSHSYFFDNEAVKEPAVEGQDMGILRSKKAADGQGPTDRASIDKRLAKNKNTRTGNPSGMRNVRSVWHMPTAFYLDSHFAVFPPELPRLCIKAGSKERDIILDPFAGSGTVGQVARELDRRSILIELNPDYCVQIMKRTQQLSLLT